MTLRKVSTDQEVELLRQIRNSSREFMTRHAAYITQDQQGVWWRDVDKSRIWVYLAEQDGCVVGYGLLKLEPEDTQAPSGKGWLTGALMTGFRERGYGTELFRQLRDTVVTLGLTPWLEVLESNERALHVYQKLGFKETGRSNGVITMRHDDE
jgi:ribosomal protein S18 acetylase RimI-like enzyme